MKIVITEDKLDDVIKKYIDIYYDKNDIHFTHYHDEDGNPLDIANEYYIGDYYDDEGGTIFRLYKKDYWENPTDYRINKSPILMIEDSDFVENLV